ncbi:hypothetical protein Tco_1283266 [Tanacetum coccineum]
MALLDNPIGSLKNVLNNQIFEISSDDSHALSIEMYLLNEEDDGDNVVIPQTPNEEIRTSIDNTSQENLEGNALDPWIPTLKQGGATI